MADTEQHLCTGCGKDVWYKGGKCMKCIGLNREERRRLQKKYKGLRDKK